jgi:hypothetical protein
MIPDNPLSSLCLPETGLREAPKTEVLEQLVL